MLRGAGKRHPPCRRQTVGLYGYGFSGFTSYFMTLILTFSGNGRARDRHVERDREWERGDGEWERQVERDREWERQGERERERERQGDQGWERQGERDQEWERQSSPFSSLDLWPLWAL